MSPFLIRILVLSSIAAFCALCPNLTVRLACADPPTGSPYVLVWSDEFNGTTLDTNKWGHLHPGYPRGGRNAVQVTDAVTVSGGKLVIRTYSGPYPDPNDPDPPPVTLTHYTGMIQTGGDLSGGEPPDYCPNNPNQLYPPGDRYLPLCGYIEARIDFDGAPGMWHSFFVNTPRGLLPGPMLPQDRGIEMDIVEHKKMAGSVNVSAKAEAAIHWWSENSPVCPNTAEMFSAGSDTVGTDLANGFHTYGLEWTPNYLKYYYDGAVVWTVNNSEGTPVSRTNEYILLCGEVPMDNFPAYGSIPSGGFGPRGASSNPKMTVEYVKVWQNVAPPADVTDLSVTCVGNTTLNLAWTAPGADSTTGTATEYDFRYSTSPITAANFNSATHLPINAPSAAGTVDNRVVTGLLACHAYFFALKTRDEWGWSGISNVASDATVCGNQLPTCDEGNPAAKLSVLSNEAPQVFSAPRPNPARGETSFQIMVPRESQGAKLRVGVYDAAGRRVRTLIDRPASPGPAQIQWNLRDNSGHRVASGIYMMRVEVGDTRKTFRLVVVR